MNDELINWLLDGEPWGEYRTRIDLLIGGIKHAPFHQLIIQDFCLATE